ncbi:hypothetical protein UF64_11550 [Thalassospira sp. HJ]|uniref:class I SAM-dependent methyltransferase n=1 Tax=Thalassospira sp. HJ TaxID=1616823 RepID=UPI0005CECB3B|nr:class I SAM-dependent methyltransferase [Thalassospira sp. HJ]KJE35266.1 hypothetical protein UF64_11550 [Thalassospira sp. HJ]
MPKPEEIYELHAASCNEDDFWGQVKRTVNGKPISEENIALIVEQSRNLLQLQRSDHVLDLCCGNGALTHRVFEDVEDVIGIDVSPSLIATAQKFFGSDKRIEYVVDDVLHGVKALAPDRAPSKAYMYGSLQYLPQGKVVELFKFLFDRFPELTRFMVGNVPDRQKKDAFYNSKSLSPDAGNDPASPIGVWYSKAELFEIASQCGWDVEFHQMPDGHHAHHYRYDAVLVRGSV